MRIARLLALFLTLQFLGAAQETTTHIGHYLEHFPGAQVYKDPNSGTLLYVETDGRHVAAISPDGKLLWDRDPFKDAHLPYYKIRNPQVYYLGPFPKSASSISGEEGDKFVVVRLTNAQLGLLRIRDGYFEFGGQD
jgi:hypothetical protein